MAYHRFVLSGLSALCLAAIGLADAPKPDPKPNLPTPARLEVVAATNNPWKVVVKVDHDNKSYELGEEVVVTVKSDEAGFLYLFNVDAAGTITCMFPNQFQNKNEIKANEEITVPDPNDKKFRIRVADPAGKEQIKAIVTKNPSQTMKLEDFTRGGPGPKKVSKLQFARLIVEAMGGKPDAVPQDNKPPVPPDPTQPPVQQQSVIQQQKEKIQQDSPAQFKEKMKEWASGEIEITTFAGKTKPPAEKDKPAQEKPKEKGKTDK